MAFESRHRLEHTFDLPVALFLTVVCVGVVRSPLADSPVVTALAGLPLLTLLPGYVTITAAFPSGVPARGRFSDGDPDDSESAETPAAGESDTLERLTLAIVGSLSLAMLLGFVLNFTPWGITRSAFVLALGGWTVAAGILAAYRRARLPAGEHRDTGPLAALSEAVSSPAPTDRREVIVYGATGIGLLVGTGTSLAAFVAPRRGETYTEFALLTENEAGELSAAGYPTTLTAGEAHPYVVEITNREGTETDYTVTADLQRVERTGDEITVRSSERLDRVETTLGPGERHRAHLDVVPTTTGDDLRLVFSLSRDGAAGAQSGTAAYRTLSHWVSVTGA